MPCAVAVGRSELTRHTSTSHADAYPPGDRHGAQSLSPEASDTRGSEIAILYRRFVTTAVTSSIVTDARKTGEGLRSVAVVSVPGITRR